MVSRKVKHTAAATRTDQEDRIAELEAELANLKAEARAENGPRHRGQQRLSTRRVETLKVKAFISDGNNLYLDSEPPSKRWVYRWKRDGRSRDFSLGMYPVIGLSEARERALECARKIAAGIDPIEERRAGRIAAKLEAVKTMTFQQCAERYIQAHEGSWRSSTHLRQWQHSLKSYVYPVIGSLPVQAVDKALVISIVEGLWSTRTETASRVRGRIETVLDWAAARGYREGENPARWKGHLENLLPKKAKLAPVKHLPAVPFDEIPELWAQLDHEGAGTSELALMFAILTVARTSELLGARWEEIDFKTRTWAIPAARTKTHKDHRIPLAEPALRILDALKALPASPYLFPANRARPISAASMWHALRRAGRPETVHGFRSSFRDWVGERTAFAGELAELALGHTVGGQVERAYRRGDQFEKRRQLAEAWARFVTSPPAAGEVVPIRGAV